MPPGTRTWSTAADTTTCTDRAIAARVRVAHANQAQSARTAPGPDGTSVALGSGVRTLLATVVAISGCAGFDTQPTDQNLVETTTAIRERMHRRFAATVAVRDAIEHGDTARTRTAATTINQLAEPDVLPAWQPFVGAIRAAAADVAAAGDPITAARAFATLGERCADCHVAANARSANVLLGSSTTTIHPESKMSSHHWAAGRLWDGLVSTSDKAWFAGAEMLERAPLTIVAEGEVPGHELGIADNVAYVRLLARRAQKAHTAHERAAIYGDVLSTCIACHQTIRDR